MKTEYQRAKAELKEYAKETKKTFTNDKPAIRMALNDYTDHLCRSGNLTESKQNLLHHYCCTLHPKNN